MTARENLLAHALAVLESDGPDGLTTRAVCSRAGVTAPTLYHHFGSADGLVSAAVEAGLQAFLRRKRNLPTSGDPGADLMSGWDDYVSFAAESPRLYCALMARVLAGADLPAARAARENLVERVERTDAAGRLAIPAAAAADLLWSTAHAAALLHTVPERPPDRTALLALRACASRVLLTTPS